MDILELQAAPRSDTGKGPAGRLRAGGRIPGVFYGQKLQAVPVSVDGRELLHVIGHEGGANAIVKLMIDGKAETAMVKDIQRDPMRDKMVHVDFMAIAMDEKITTHVTLTIVGDSVGVSEGGVIQQIMREVEVEALPMELPDHIEVDATDIAIGDSLRVSDLTAPEGVTILSNQDDMVMSVVPPAKIEEVVPVEEEVEGEVEVVGEEGAAEEGAAPAEESSGE